MLLMTDVLTDDQIEPTVPSSGGVTGSVTGATGTNPTSTTQRITAAPTGPATTDPVGSSINFPAQLTDSASPAPTGAKGSALDSWWAQHGQGERFSVINGSLIDMALLTYNSIMGSPVGTGGMTQEIKDSYGLTESGLVSSVSGAQKSADDSWQYALTHGGWSNPQMNPNSSEFVSTTSYTPPAGGDVSAPTSGTTSPAATGGGTYPGASTQGPTGGSGSGLAAGGDQVSRLIDLVAGMYSSAGVKGGGSGFGGLVSGPLSSSPDTNTGELATPVKKKSSLGMIFVLLIVAAGGWYYYKHHKRGVK